MKRSLEIIAINLFAWVLTGCGVLFAPVALHDVRTQNRRAHIFGTITDEEGRELQGVDVRIVYYPMIWDWLSGTRNQERDLRLTVDGHIHEEVTTEGSSTVRVFLNKDGYKPLALYVWHDEAELDAPHSGITLTKDTTKIHAILKKQSHRID